MTWPEALQSLNAMALAAVLAAIPILVAAMLQKLGLDKQTKLESQLDGVLSEGAGIAYKCLADKIATGALDSVPAQNEAIAKGVHYVHLLLPIVVDKLGLTPEQVGAKVEAKLGQLLGSDPTTSVQIPNPVMPVPVQVVGDPPSPTNSQKEAKS
jgi:hypothetical protein